VLGQPHVLGLALVPARPAAGKLEAKAVVNSRDMLESLLAGQVRPHGDELLEAFAGGGPAAPPRTEDEAP
jgi:hypothetical protein